MAQEQQTATARAPVVAPALPERIRDELELEDLRREKERRDLEIELGINHDLQQMKKLLDLLDTADEVQERLKKNPDLRNRYDAIVGSAGGRGCSCLATAQVLWLGTAASQAGQADIRLGDDIHNVKVGATIGNTRCRLAEILAAPDGPSQTPTNAVRAVLACGGARRERQLYSGAIDP